jgi:hypothetical protein
MYDKVRPIFGSMYPVLEVAEARVRALIKGEETKAAMKLAVKILEIKEPASRVGVYKSKRIQFVYKVIRFGAGRPGEYEISEIKAADLDTDLIDMCAEELLVVSKERYE